MSQCLSFDLFQLKTIPVGLDNISMPSEETCKMAQDLAQTASVGDESGKKKWRRGELLFESYVRFLDNAVSRDWWAVIG